LQSALFTIAITDLISRVHITSRVYATQRIEILHILQLLWSIKICTGERFLEILINLDFAHIRFHSTASSNFSQSINHAL
jgi:hypothetical protein